MSAAPRNSAIPGCLEVISTLSDFSERSYGQKISDDDRVALLKFAEWRRAL